MTQSPEFDLIQDPSNSLLRRRIKQQSTPVMIFFLPNYSRPAALCLLQEQLQKQYAVVMKHLRLLPHICFKRIGIPVCMERTSQYLPGLAVATVVINGGNQVEKFRWGQVQNICQAISSLSRASTLWLATKIKSKGRRGLCDGENQ